MKRDSKRPTVSGKSTAPKTSSAVKVVYSTVAKDKIDETSTSKHSQSSDTSDDFIPEPPEKMLKIASSGSSLTPDSVFAAVTERPDSVSISLKNGIQLEANENSFKITTDSDETIFIKSRTTTIHSGPCVVVIKDGAIRIRTKEMDSMLNFQQTKSNDDDDSDDDNFAHCLDS